MRTLEGDRLGLGGVFIAWAPQCGRTRGLADRLGLRPLWIHHLKFRKPWCAPFKYPIQAIRTCALLWQIRPKIVFVQNPPVFAVICVWLFSILTGTPFVIDSHSGVFESKKWKWALPIHRLFSRRTVVTLVTNDALRKLVESWGEKAMVVHDTPIYFSPVECAYEISKFQVFVPCSFGKDEMINHVLSAAKMMQDIHFVLTGDVHGQGSEFLVACPENVTFTGWLSEEEYADRICTADIVLTLTTNERTLLRGAWEAMYAGRPLITSERAALREYFTEGTIFVGDTVEDIVTGVRQACEHRDDLRAQMTSLRQEKANESEEELGDLFRLCEQYISNKYG